MHKVMGPETPPADPIGFEDFLRVDIRAGTIVHASPFPEARNPAYRLRVDFGPAIGVLSASAQITERHALDDLVGRRVMAVVNFPPRQVGPMMSEVLLLGFPDAAGAITLAEPMGDIADGARLS